jgi:DMSO/TMAO reductase YedYZ molybdopterin-dependent catalytic subunit
MATAKIITRRVAILGGAAGAGLLIANSDTLTLGSDFARVSHAVEDWTRTTQRGLLFPDRMAREYSPSDISPFFKPNGTYNPGTPDYNADAAQNFANWRLKIDGLVARPLSLSVAELKRLPRRTQITKHDCVEGWTAIGMWTGVPVGLLLKAAGLRPGARYVVLHCAENLTGEPAKGGEQSPGQYYESIDLRDAFHPQTILAYGFNGKALDVPHGAPLRLRVERQLGYKQAKYVERIQIVDSFASIAGGRGGYWEDRGYEWYAGI